MNEETFQRVLREKPGDELTWKALADWLDESGQADRAELLRLTRRMMRLPSRERAEIRQRMAALLAAGVRPVVVQKTNSIGMKFVLIPAGKFLMGSPRDEKGRDLDEGPSG